MTEAGVKTFNTSIRAPASGSTSSKSVLEAITSMESKIGANVAIDQVDLAAFLDGFRQFNLAPMMVFAFSVAPTMDASNVFGFFTSNHSPDRFFNNKDFDKLVADASKELDVQKRQKLLQQAEGLLVQNDAGIFVYDQINIYASPKNVQGFAWRPDGVIDVTGMTKS
jgi:peptide/nickel transport system substrate-binding protein